MTTDTDATAARLLNKVLAPLVTVDCYNLSSPHDYALWRNEISAALDTLIQYHRQAGAVEALEQWNAALDEMMLRDQGLPAGDRAALQYARDNGQIVPSAYVCNAWVQAVSKQALAAAQARLAAYEEER